jgi:hypothetical protein
MSTNQAIARNSRTSSFTFTDKPTDETRKYLFSASISAVGGCTDAAQARKPPNHLTLAGR